jgi:hypothetical protein
MNEFVSMQTADDPANVEPVIAGTLALMTQFEIHRRVCLVAKISRNLEWLATCSHLSPPFRTLCERLQVQWTETLHEMQVDFANSERQGVAVH